MDGDLQFLPPKRPIVGLNEMLEPSAATFSGASNGALTSKRTNHPLTSHTVPAGHVVFRLICNTSRIGGLIGKSGCIVKKLQQDTASKIIVEDPVSETDEQVIVVIASSSVNRTLFINSARGGDIGGFHLDLSAAQEAVVRVFERILDVAADMDGFLVASRSLVSFRLLAETSHASSVIGKGGKIVTKIRQSTGCRINVLSHDNSPPCALPFEETIEIEGEIVGVKRALIAVCSQLQDCQTKDIQKVSNNMPPQASRPNILAEEWLDVPPKWTSLQSLNLDVSHVTNALASCALSEETDNLDSRAQHHELVFGLLCYSYRVGSVIGKGGSIHKALQDETGASIAVGPSVDNCDERLITITAMESPLTDYSPAQNAVLLVFSRCTEVVWEKGSQVSARLVVRRNNVGCLMGKGGSIVSDIRRLTGAGIHILRADQMPNCVSESDQVVQITGKLDQVQDTLREITYRLRNHLFQNNNNIIDDGAGIRSCSHFINEMNHPDERPLYPSSLGSSRHVPSTYIVNENQFPFSSGFDSFPPEIVAEINSRYMTGIDRGVNDLERSHMARNTTVDFLVPENSIGSVCGENGSNLTRIRQISGARVLVCEPYHGITERAILISGTEDEIQTAQSLLHAFLLNEK
ncbi:KH domain-containing protein HEN4-like isoform X2 [Impatiens glandulifera]|uniref:KH domain-containing protein HEN4-like isoform X2 n=1 Tax=Impatiens glandulifera TaxID=253017 RepID=UPI001FB06E4E|nr:KH domain-containing protein HEN4-like isoform X2 [Impatiens glandulifera]